MINDYDNTSVQLSWTKPEKDGGRPITHYVIEAKEKLGVEWKELMVTTNDNTAANVTGLKENSVLQFRVRAVNKAGIGEPSDPTDNHTVKHSNRNIPVYIISFTDLVAFQPELKDSKIGKLFKMMIDLISKFQLISD